VKVIRVISPAEERRSPARERLTDVQGRTFAGERVLPGGRQGRCPRADLVEMPGLEAGARIDVTQQGRAAAALVVESRAGLRESRVGVVVVEPGQRPAA
jgi:hypothetical protein